MNRRGFFGRLIGTVAALAVAPALVKVEAPTPPPFVPQQRPQQVGWYDSEEKLMADAAYRFRVAQAHDQMMQSAGQHDLNYMQSKMTESIQLQAKAPFILAEDQMTKVRFDLLYGVMGRPNFGVRILE